jgi:hypothetical protein
MNLRAKIIYRIKVADKLVLQIDIIFIIQYTY